jgi:hypothetical protein
LGFRFDFGEARDGRGKEEKGAGGDGVGWKTAHAFPIVQFSLAKSGFWLR